MPRPVRLPIIRRRPRDRIGCNSVRTEERPACWRSLSAAPAKTAGAVNHHVRSLQQERVSALRQRVCAARGQPLREGGRRAHARVTLLQVEPAVEGHHMQTDEPAVAAQPGDSQSDTWSSRMRSTRQSFPSAARNAAKRAASADDHHRGGMHTKQRTPAVSKSNALMESLSCRMSEVRGARESVTQTTQTQKTPRSKASQLLSRW